MLSGSSVAAVGNNFTVKGFGFFSESGTTQMMMQGNSGATLGQLELYTYQPSTASFAGIDVGKVGSNLTFLGCADLLGNGSTQMVMQQNNSDIWLYSYNAGSNTLSGTEVGAIGSNFHVVGFGPLGTSGQDEMLMQDAAGDFEVYQYNAGLNAFVGLQWERSARPGWLMALLRMRRAPPPLRPLRARNSCRPWRRYLAAQVRAPQAPQRPYQHWKRRHP